MCCLNITNRCGKVSDSHPGHFNPKEGGPGTLAWEAR